MSRSAFLNLIRAVWLPVCLLSFTAFGNTHDGVCTGADRAHLYSDNHVFAKTWNECSGVFGLKISCVQKVFPEMTTDCLNCFAEMTACAIEHCKSKCAPWPIGYGSTSSQCEECSMTKCGPQLYKCSGVSRVDIPQLKR